MTEVILMWPCQQFHCSYTPISRFLLIFSREEFFPTVVRVFIQTLTSWFSKKVRMYSTISTMTHPQLVYCLVLYSNWVNNQCAICLTASSFHPITPGSILKSIIKISCRASCGFITTILRWNLTQWFIHTYTYTHPSPHQEI